FIGRIHHLDLIGDCAISPDGDLLFLTGVHNQQIYCFIRKGSAYEKQDFSARFGNQTSPVKTSSPVSDSLWRTNLSDAFAEIIHPSSPYSYLAAVFYSSDILASQQFLTSQLTDELRKQFPRILWTKIDVKLYPGFLSSYSIFRVPTIIVFNARGEQLLRLINPASQQTIIDELAGFKK
ncbi:MAG: thioredoxin family protein, partial [Candidatus Sumerlaeia bacterium]|nr:thioredoxin family protein [Candidatus Sumerlaeia bacterium]